MLVTAFSLHNIGNTGYYNNSNNAGNDDDDDKDDDPAPDPNVGGGAGSCGSGYYSPKCSGWHFYRTTNLVCPSLYQCTPEEIADALARYSVPNPFLFGIPVHSGDTNSVFPFGQFPAGSTIYNYGLITTEVSKDGLIASNVGGATHMFYDGKVTRRAYQDDEGAWYVQTTGMGNNVRKGMDSPNQAAGPTIFNVVDRAMFNYLVPAGTWGSPP